MTSATVEMTDLHKFESFVDKLRIDPYTKTNIKLILFDCWWAGYECRHNSKLT